LRYYAVHETALKSLYLLLKLNMNNIELIKGNLIEYGIKAVDDQSFNGSEKVYNDKYKSVTEELVKETVDFLSKALDEEQIIISLYYVSKLPGLRENRKDMLAK